MFVKGFLWFSGGYFLRDEGKNFGSLPGISGIIAGDRSGF
jgi:hypothetical protein